jgi:hypothetical protein
MVLPLLEHAREQSATVLLAAKNGSENLEPRWFAAVERDGSIPPPGGQSRFHFAPESPQCVATFLADVKDGLVIAKLSLANSSVESSCPVCLTLFAQVPSLKRISGEA